MDAVSRICSCTCCMAPFECERKAWQDSTAVRSIQEPLSGLAECPLKQFPAENTGKHIACSKLPVNRAELTEICRKCKYKKGGRECEECPADYIREAQWHDINDSR